MVPRPILLVLLLLASFAFGVGALQQDPIEVRIGKLRSMDDQARAAETKQIALTIAALPASDKKVLFASLLANLSTEGDFGADTLQTVADTLVMSLKQTPPTVRNDQTMFPYVQLAQLERFEHVQVKLVDPNYEIAKVKILQLEKQRAAADFTLKDLDGKLWTRSQLKGKVVLVNFWATWCPPCRKEMPDMDKLYKRFRDQGLVVLAISDEADATVRSFIVQQGYTYPILLDPGRKTNVAFGVDGIPKSFVYDREGKLVAQAIDARTEQQFLKMLAKAGLK